MFTGLVEDVGTVVRADRSSAALMLGIRPDKLDINQFSTGESISHDGVCLTYVSMSTANMSYVVTAGAETLARTTLGELRIGSRVNLERALIVGSRLGGHWVSGHIDGTGEIQSRRDLGANLVLVVRTAPKLLRYIVEKGSIAVAGVSLTVNSVDDESFSVAIVPHTRDNTTLGDFAVGARVNLETDLVAKHVEKLLAFAPGERTLS